MKPQNKILFLFAALLSLFILFPQQAHSCHRSYVECDSVVQRNGYYDIYVTVCMGGGVTGNTFGAINHTKTVAFNFFGTP